jgi:dienelactone hydrolase
MAGWRYLGIMVLGFLSSLVFAAQSNPPVMPDHVPTAFEERAVSLSSNDKPFSATLTLPSKRKGRIPAVIFVPGSEPESTEPTRDVEAMFADMARALAFRGIASLRLQEPPFPFSTLLGPKRLPLDEQIVNDAVVALNYVAHLPEIDGAALSIIGHHVGGTMAPYIAERYGHIRGIVLLAAAARPIEETLAERRKNTLEAQGASRQEVVEQLAGQNQIFADIRSGKISPTRLMDGATVAYWRDRMNRDCARKARDLHLPMLILQGGRDTRVTEADYDRLQSVLSKTANPVAQFHWFPNLDHFFKNVPSTASSGSESARGQVDAVVTRTIVSWIESLSAPHQEGR